MVVACRAACRRMGRGSKGKEKGRNGKERRQRKATARKGESKGERETQRAQEEKEKEFAFSAHLLTSQRMGKKGAMHRCGCVSYEL